MSFFVFVLFLFVFFFWGGGGGGRGGVKAGLTHVTIKSSTQIDCRMKIEYACFTLFLNAILQMTAL